MRPGLPLLLLILFIIPSASAHAVLETATPLPDGNAPVGTSRITLAFTEAVERRYTDADVFDLNGTSLRAAAIEFDAQNARVIHLPTQPLGDGIYSVSWQTLSVDTHTARGTFLFSVGNASLVPAGSTVEHDHEAGAGTTAEGSSRAAFFLGAFLVAGLALFTVAFDTVRAPSPALLRSGGAMGLLGGASGVISLWYFVERTGLTLTDAMGTVAGRSLGLRAAFVAIAALLAFLAAARPAERRRGLVWGTAVFGGLALVATSLGSHAAALGEKRTLAVLIDMVHLATGAVWVGGVAAFVLVARHRSPIELARSIARFSPTALACVGLLIATGTAASALHLTSPADLWLTPYGRLIAGKVLLLLPLIALGAYNQKVLAPRLAQGRPATGSFRTSVAFEAVAMVTVLLLAGLLTTTAPPDLGAQTAEQAPRFELDQNTETTHIIFTVDPAPPEVGVQRIQVILHPLTRGGIPNSTLVGLKFAPPGQPEPEELVTPQKATPGDWRLEGGYFTEVGVWKVYVILQRPDEYKKLVFEVPVGAPGQGEPS